MTTPEVGMGATALMHSDRHAYTIVEVVSPTRVVVQRDHATRTDAHGASDSQTYSYAPNPSAPRLRVNLLRDGRWHEGRSMRDGTVFVLGRRDEYFDYTF